MSRRRKHSYARTRIALDIETSSWVHDGQKYAATYLYTFSVNGVVTHIRSHEGFIAFLNDLSATHGTSVHGQRAVIFVHFLGYEFGFVREIISDRLEWSDAFPIGSSHNVARALTTTGLEFRCSLALTAMPLALVGKDVGVKKLVGDLDHSLIRHFETPLTDEELAYARNDVLILDALIAKKLLDDDFETMPMTRTGYVRRRVRNAVFRVDGYREMIERLKETPSTYRKARAAFQGGYTHANGRYAGQVVHDVRAADLVSSYLGSIAQFKYPMSQFESIDVKSEEELEDILARVCALIDVTFHDIECNYSFPTISSSKCLELEGDYLDNGRVYSASKARLVLTDVDFRLARRNYSMSRMTINSVKIAKRGYLPKALVLAVVELYARKTTLKDIPERIEEYVLYKGDGNAVYGMCATDPVRVSWDLVGQELIEAVSSTEEALAEHNKSRSRFLYYPWASWITAYSRYILLDTIMRMEDAGVIVYYCDTDSDYYGDCPEAQAILDAVNAEVRRRLDAAMAHHGLTEEEGRELVSPMDVHGVRHTLGVFEDDNHGETIADFKTLGAKRYAKRMWDQEAGKMKFEVTVAGLNKKKAGAYIEEHGGMDFFNDGMTVPAGPSGRMTHSYSREHFVQEVTDYLGQTATVEQHGFIHLEASPYVMAVSNDYADFIQRFQQSGIVQ